MSEHPDRVRRAVRLAYRFDPLHRYIAAVRVYMRIDQARHQRAPADVEHSRVLVGNRLWGDLLDQSVGDAQIHALGALGVRSVEDTGILEEKRCHRR